MSTLRNVPPIGVHANAWDAAATASGTSNIIDIWNYPFVSVFGNTSGAVTITLQLSADGTNFYDADTVAPSGAGNFKIHATVGARYVRLKSSANVTVTATIQAKG